MQAMFHTVAPRYNFITRAFSYGMDRRWKRRCVELARLRAGAVVLDLAAGTGDFSVMVAREHPGARPVAVDLTERMLKLARSRGLSDAVCGDAGVLPFADNSFDCVFIGYGLRNFSNLDKALREIVRVTRPGGSLVTLDFFIPSHRFWRYLYLGYLYLQGTFWGLILHGRARVYTYIPDSLRSFLSVEDFTTRLIRLGYEEVKAHRYVLGGIGLHRAAKNHRNGSKAPA
jgi:demethylmenaquinone methyltransferase / 2-methoxy-6-polyprenyl-1,4-benzoquinol methylase